MMGLKGTKKEAERKKKIQAVTEIQTPRRSFLPLTCRSSERWYHDSVCHSGDKQMTGAVKPAQRHGSVPTPGQSSSAPLRVLSACHTGQTGSKRPIWVQSELFPWQHNDLEVCGLGCQERVSASVWQTISGFWVCGSLSNWIWVI